MKLNKKCKCGCEIIFEVDKTYKLPKFKECFKCGNKVEIVSDEKEEENNKNRTAESSLPENNSEQKAI